MHTAQDTLDRIDTTGRKSALFAKLGLEFMMVSKADAAVGTVSPVDVPRRHAASPALTASRATPLDDHLPARAMVNGSPRERASSYRSSRWQQYT